MASRLRIPASPRDDARMTLIEHLGELRSRIIKVAAVFVLAAIVTWFFREWLFYFLLDPAGGQFQDQKLVVTAVGEQFISDMKLALWAAFVLAIPVLLYQAWAFVAPAVGDMGRVTTYIIITLASSLFLAGIAFGYYFVLPAGLKFLLFWDQGRYETMITPTYYLSFTTRFLLACGIFFELPAATYVCAKLGLIDANLLKKYRKHAIVVNTILAAAITPSPDPFTMIMLAVPLIIMYELSIVIARYVNPTTEVTAHELARTDDDEDEPDHTDEDRDDDDYDPEPHEENGNERDL
jgi:sec-independent protein translocase protein TatC